MKRGSVARSIGRTWALGGLLLALASGLLAGGRDAAAQQAATITSSLVATHEMSGVPSGRRWVVRGEHPLNVEHVHSGGFVLVTSRASVLQMEGSETVLQEGQGIWVPEGVPHTHRAEAGAQLWSCSLETEAEAATAPALFVSKELSASVEGPHLARMTADLYSVGASTPPHRHLGPEAVFVREGTYELNLAGLPQNYSAGQGYTVEPRLPHRLRNAGQEPARLFNLSMVPLGQVTGEPVPPEALR